MMFILQLLNHISYHIAHLYNSMGHDPIFDHILVFPFLLLKKVTFAKVIKSIVFREVNPSNYKNLIDKALYCYTRASDRYAFALLLRSYIDSV